MWEATIPVERLNWNIAKVKQPPQYIPIIVYNPISKQVTIYVNRELLGNILWLTLDEFTRQVKKVTNHACKE